MPARLLQWLALLAVIGVAAAACRGDDAQPTAYFIDGYHGGVYGHYPPGYTQFLVDQLTAHPDWRINLEIEPATWDVARASEPRAYAELQRLMEDQSDQGRIEVVNPTYAQSYFFQGSGESAIRQFEYGIRELKEHFPGVRLTTYSSEEPCFTSCLPAVLRSFGYEYASLKNPNTCWGGYTAAHGGELVNWIGPDGSSLLTVPRYDCEGLKDGSCWETTAARLSPDYVAACLQQGIKRPLGMCLQDAGWRGGPWLKSSARDHYGPAEYVTWRDYLRNQTPATTSDNWRFSQEDVKPGLMWGAQALQRIAQQSRAAENQLLVAEKLAAMAYVTAGHPANADALDEAWRNVLLSQHHDCWIVPYNGRPGNTWADQVRRWTGVANSVSELAIEQAIDAVLKSTGRRGRNAVRLFNPTASPVDAIATLALPAGRDLSGLVTIDSDGRRTPVQVARDAATGKPTLLVRGNVPPLGHATLELHDDAEPTEPAIQTTRTDNEIIIESDLLRLAIEPSKGGAITSLVAKDLGDREFVDGRHQRGFNELRGHFYDDGGFRSTADQPAEVRVVEDGPIRATVEITATIASHRCVQRVSIAQGSPVIDCSVRLEWDGDARIGEFAEREGWSNRRRPAYDDRFKLLAMFPAALDEQRVSKSAAFDVCESQLEDTFYNSWEDIKHNLILDWVDVADGGGDYGLALFSDHTTSYAHGPDFPLSLNLQYAGKGLWARDYRVDGPTEVRYALMPHAGRWDEAQVARYAAAWQQPIVAAFGRGRARQAQALVDLTDSGWQAPAFFESQGDLYLRLFNSQGDDEPHRVALGFQTESVDLVELDGRVVRQMELNHDRSGHSTVQLAIPRFGFRTLRIRLAGESQPARQRDTAHNTNLRTDRPTTRTPS